MTAGFPSLCCGFTSPSTDEVCAWGGLRIRTCKLWNLGMFGLASLGAMLKH